MTQRCYGNSQRNRVLNTPSSPARAGPRDASWTQLNTSHINRGPRFSYCTQRLVQYHVSNTISHNHHHHVEPNGLSLIPLNITMQGSRSHHNSRRLKHTNMNVTATRVWPPTAQVPVRWGTRHFTRHLNVHQSQLNTTSIKYKCTLPKSKLWRSKQYQVHTLPVLVLMPARRGERLRVGNS